MNASPPPLIPLNGIKKGFYTDEVETHALAGIHLEIQQGEYVAIAGPSGDKAAEAKAAEAKAEAEKKVEERKAAEAKAVAEKKAAEKKEQEKKKLF